MIIAIGEVVWDIFPDHQALGGAPVNVAYHLNTLGLPAQAITRIGADELGEKTLQRIAALGLSIAGIQRDPLYPTGRVDITLDKNNEPNFEIVAPAAWDYINRDEAVGLAGNEPFHLVFGTLAQRNRESREAIRALWQKASVRLYDVNLRPPFTDMELVQESLAVADITKLNSDELKKICAALGIYYADAQSMAAELRKRFAIQTVVITEGPAGAWLISPEGFFAHPGFSVQSADPVGAGDAFFAALIQGIARKMPWPECLARANQRGAYVASQPGATPVMPEENI